MQQPLLNAPQTQDERRGYYGAYEYNLQATDDQEDQDGAPEPKKPRVWRIGDVPDYKPTALRWPFILGVVILLSVAIGLIVYAQKAMPDSDSDAIILGLHPTRLQPLPGRLMARATNESTTSTMTHTSASRKSTSTRSTSVSTSDILNVGAITSSSSTITSLPSGAILVPISTAVSSTPTFVTIPGSVITITETISAVRTTTFTKDLTYATTFVTTEDAPVSTKTLFTLITANFTLISSPFATIAPTATQAGVTLTLTKTDQTAIASTVTEATVTTRYLTSPGTVIPTFGPVTVTYYETIIPKDPATIEEPNTVGRPGQPTVVTEIVEENTVTFVDTKPPVVIAVPTFDVTTEVISVVETGVTLLGGGEVTNVVVITPTIAVAVPKVTSVDGKLTTVDEFVAASQPGQPVTFTVFTEVGGTPTQQVVVTTPVGPPFQPVVITTTRMVGGTPSVVVVTPAPTNIVTTVNGSPVTIAITPPVTSFTTIIGGTPTTEVITITPTGTAPITLTFVSTASGSLSTFTTTYSPTTVVTTISGKLTTITSTPSPSTGVSTISGSTRIFTSILAPTKTGTGSPSGSVIASTKVYSWGPSDLFVGTFLPPLLGIGMVILIRVIDLNVKLYQPFQSLARGQGATGAESLTMQYSGVMAWVTPVITMLQGHPVPFISTLMVGCASFVVPLATEAIGLKLHGRCYTNTADTGCGPALGISPSPANALIGLIAAVIIMLLLILYFSMRWPTGLHANPWNLAGIASLAGSTQVRVHQNTEKAIKEAVSQKQYALGYYENAAGREEYGIILTDDSGQGLRERGAVDGDAFDGTTTARMGSKKLLPLMPLRLPWRIALIVFQLTILIFIIYYHVYYRGGVNDGGKLWGFMNSNKFGMRFLCAAVGVIIAFCWQSFFLSVSVMTPFQLMARRTQPPERSILFSPSTNPFSGIYTAVKNRHVFLFATSLAAILSEFLPVLLSNVPFSLSQTYTAATVCAVMAAIFLGILLIVLITSFFIRYPPMPVDPRSIAGAMYYVSQSQLLNDFEGVSQLDAEEREYRVKIMGRRYFYGVLVGGSWRRMGVDYDMGPSENVATSYQGARGHSANDSFEISHQDMRGHTAQNSVASSHQDTRGYTANVSVPTSYRDAGRPDASRGDVTAYGARRHDAPAMEG